MNLHKATGAIILAALSWFVSVPSAQTAGLCQGIAIPAYFYPGPLWTAALDAAPTATVLVMNPDSGPGLSQNLEYVEAVQAAQAAGITVLGYVYTSYGSRSSLELAVDIEAYKEWYGVDGIFLDEVRSDTAGLEYYKELVTSIKASKGSFVMLNPGLVPDEGYVKMADTTIVFEDSYADYRKWTPPAWLYKYPAGKITHLVYGVASVNKMKIAVNLSRRRNAGMIYITDDLLPNPWDSLPSYWTAERNRLIARCAP